MKIRFKNARILTMEGELTLLKGEVHVKEEKISYLGKTVLDQEIDSTNWDRIIDCKGNILMPGFKNAHTHSAMTFLRSYADDLPLLEWLHKQVFPNEAKLKDEDMYYLSILAYMEYVTSGITANFDMYMAPDEVARASIDTGFRTVLCGSANDFGGSRDSLKAEYDRLNKLNGLVSYQLGFHAEYTTNRKLLEEIADLAKDLQTPVFTHNSETKDEVQGCIERYGMTPTAFLNSIGMFQYGGGGFHCVHMTEEDIDICKEKGLYVVTNPGSNCKLASGTAPLTQMSEKGIKIAIGTDGPASNNCLDMFKEMFLATSMQKLILEDATALDALEVLKMATVNGAHAMGLTDCDVLAVGKKADIIMIDLQQPNMQPLNNVIKNIVYSGSKTNIKMTMINGKILYEDGRFSIGKEPEEIYTKANEIIKRIINEG